MIRAPFPWFGGKALAADLIWSRLGSDLGTFIEPFAGSCAVALNRPAEFDGWITLNDIDGNLSNFWRSMQKHPEIVAEHAVSPVNECDLHARHLFLVNNVEKLTARLMADPDYCEPKTAAWYAWGACMWIGSGWCAGDGPWRAVIDDEGFPSFQRVGDNGRGVNRKIPHLGDNGRGVNRKIPHLGDNGQGVNRLEWLNEWFSELSELLYSARVACGSWERVCSPGTMTRNGIAGVLLDPPYSLTGAVYANDSSTISGDVREWCVKNGSNPDLRIALCGHVGEGHEVLESLGWTVEEWGKGGGYQGADDRERIWFSPACLSPVHAEVKEGLFA
jgi:hypothetical protein